MSRVSYLKCDFCGRDVSQMSGVVCRHKIRREWRGHDTLFWDNLDICTDCLSEIRRKIREKERSKQDG